MINLIYLDNNATTKVLPEVRDAMIKYLTDEYGNPSSKYYQLAINAKRVLMMREEMYRDCFHVMQMK